MAAGLGRALAESGRRSRRAPGYALVELLIVLALFGILAGVTALALSHALDKARQRTTVADMFALAQAIDGWVELHGAAPPAGGGIDALCAHVGATLPHHDAWGHPFEYTTLGATSYRLESHGKDGIPGEDVTLATRFDFDRDIVLADGRFVAAPE